MKATYYITLNILCLHYLAGTVLLKYIIAVYCQIYKHLSVQSVSEYLENFISKGGKEFLSIYLNKHFASEVQLNYLLTHICPTSLR